MPSAARKKPQTGPQSKALRGPIKIQASRSVRGTTYALDGDSRRALQAMFPDVRVAPSVYVATETANDFEEVQGKFWKQIALLLTGLPTSKLKELGVILYDPWSGKEVERLFP